MTTNTNPKGHTMTTRRQDEINCQIAADEGAEVLDLPALTLRVHSLERAAAWRIACADLPDATDPDFIEAVNRVQAFAARLNEKAFEEGTTLSADLADSVQS